MRAPKGFRLGAMLGAGTMGSVYEAHHEATGSRVALKIVHPSTPRAVVAVENEVASMARVNHPNLLYLYDWGTVDDARTTVWMALEFASGGSLEGWEPTTWAEVAAVSRDLLAGLAHAHARGLVHRDLKPENILRCSNTDRRPGLKIADFGLARAHHTDTGARRGGTPLYIPPEQFRLSVGPGGPWSDLYAFGAVLWHWVTGQPVFERDSPVATARAHADEPLPAFQPRFPIPADVEPLLRQLLQKDPSARPQRVAELSVLLPDLAWASTTVAEATPASPLPGMGLGLLGQRELPVVGRRDLQESMVATLQRVRRRGLPTVLVLLGRPDVGRSHLATWLAAWADEVGLAVQERDASELMRRLLAGEDLDRTRVILEPGDVAEELAFVRAPLLMLVVAERRADVPGLQSLPDVEWLTVPALEPGAFRHLLASELGMHPDLVLRLAEPVSCSPGRVVKWLQDLGANGRLRATARGVELEGSLVPPPGPTEAGVSMLRGALDGLAAPVVLGLRLGALLGSNVRMEEWRPLLAVFELVPRPSGVRALVRAGLAQRDPDGWHWTDDAVRVRLLDNLHGVAEYHLAVSAVLAALEPTPERTIRCIEHLVGAGRIHRALEVCAGLVGAQVEIQRRAVSLVRPYLSASTADQRLTLAMMETRSVLNLLSAVDAIPYAETLLRCANEVEHDAVEARGIAAAVFTHGRRAEQAIELLDALPETAAMLRLRGLVAVDAGDVELASACYQRALAIVDDVPMRARLANGIGTLACRMGRHADAVRWFAHAADTIEPFVRYVPEGNLALALLELGRPSEALPHAIIARDQSRGHGPRRAAYGALVCAFAACLARHEWLLRDVREQAEFALRSHTIDDFELLVRLCQTDAELPASCRQWLTSAADILRARA